MTLELVLLGCFMAAQLMLSWVRSREILHARLRAGLRRTIWLLATCLAFVVLLAASGVLISTAWLAVAIPLGATVMAAHVADPAYSAASLRHRIFLAGAPVFMLAVSICLSSTNLRTLMNQWPLGVVGFALLGAWVGAYQGWRDFQNIAGMEPDDWVMITTEPEPSRAASRLSDYETWTRILLVSILIVILVLQVALAKSSVEQFGIWPWALLPSLAGFLCAGASRRVTPGAGGVGFVRPIVSLLSSAAVLLSAISIVMASSRMLAFSNLSGAAAAYRIGMGILVGSMFAEDLIVSFFKLNDLPMSVSDKAHAAASGLSFATIFTSAATVSYYGDGRLRMDWVLFNGALILFAWATSTLAWQAIGRQIPNGRLLTLKRPQEIALADNSMFIALLGGCVAGASLLSNGQDPRVAGALGTLIVMFIAFAVGNDRQHLRNEKARLLGEGVRSDRSKEERTNSLFTLRAHLRFQEVVPSLIVGFSYVWAIALDWL